METLSSFFILCCLGFVFLKFVLPFLVRQHEQNRLAASSMAQIDAMDGRQFEHYLGVLFRHLGYQVEVTKYCGDYGADLVLRQGEVRTVVQAKRYRRAVGIKAVQEVVAAKGMYGCSEAMVVTNSHFTDAAENLARANSVVLWNRERLMGASADMQRQMQSSQGQVAQGQPQGNQPCFLPSTSFRTHNPQQSYSSKHVPSSVMPPPTSQDAKRSYSCATCGVLISPRVAEFCLDQPDRFGGRTYCMNHQKFIRRIA